MKRKITAAAAFALCVAMGVCACSPSEKEDTFTGKEKEEPVSYTHLDVYKRQALKGADEVVSL